MEFSPIKPPPLSARADSGAASAASVGAVSASTGTLDADELGRYARQLRLVGFGPGGQARLKAATVLIVGAGGLGSPAAMYLAAAGVGRIGIADGDRVDVSNLHRQILHRDADVGSPKAQSAQETLSAINPRVRVDAIAHRVSRANALDLVREYDVVIDATDNFPTRYLLNDACVMSHRPLIYGSVDQFEGQVSVLATESGPCYRCLFPVPPDPGAVQSCGDAGVLGVLPGLIGTLQATETLKLILGVGEGLIGRLLLVDTLSMCFRGITVERDAACPVCGTREMDQLTDYEAFCSGRQDETSAIPEPGQITPLELSALIAAGDPIVLVDVREPEEWQIARLPAARLLPLGSLGEAPDALPSGANIVVYCHHGGRSDMAARYLIASGFRRVRNLVGGIDRWSTEVDSRVPRY